MLENAHLSRASRNYPARSPARGRGKSRSLFVATPPLRFVLPVPQLVKTWRHDHTCGGHGNTREEVDHIVVPKVDRRGDEAGHERSQEIEEFSLVTVSEIERHE